MSRRFGRNQRRKLRAEVATMADMVLAANNVAINRGAALRAAQSDLAEMRRLGIHALSNEAKTFLARHVADVLRQVVDEHMRKLLAEMQRAGISSAALDLLPKYPTDFNAEAAEVTYMRIRIPEVVRNFAVNLKKLGR